MNLWPGRSLLHTIYMYFVFLGKNIMALASCFVWGLLVGVAYFFQLFYVLFWVSWTETGLSRAL